MKSRPARWDLIPGCEAAHKVEFHFELRVYRQQQSLSDARQVELAVIQVRFAGNIPHVPFMFDDDGHLNPSFDTVNGQFAERHVRRTVLFPSREKE